MTDLDQGSTAPQPPDGWRELLTAIPFLALVPTDLKDLIVESFEPMSFSFGETILEEGQMSPAMFVIISGQARVLRHGPGNVEIPLRRIGPGASFGAPCLLQQRPASATIRASSDLQVMALDDGVFRAVSRRNPAIREALEEQLRDEQLHDFFRVHTVLTGLSSPLIDELSRRVQSVTVEPDVTVITEGDGDNPMYFVAEGRLRARRDFADGEQDIAFLRVGDHFGELFALRDAPAAADIESVTDCRLLRLDAPDARELLTTHPEFRERLEEHAATYLLRPASHVPLDFPEALPADARVQAEVSLDEVDAIEDTLEASTATDSAADEADDRFKGPRPRIRRMPLVWQIDVTDCGAACLAMVCRHFGRDVPLAHIRSLVNTSTDGTSLTGITLGAEELGLATRTVKSSPANLDRLAFPAIAHYGGNHWVVVYGANAKHVRVADPATGIRKLPRAEFEKEWTGYIALFAVTPAFLAAPVGGPSLRWVLPFFRPHRRALGLAVVLAMLVAGLQASLPIFTKVVVDDVLPDADRGLLTIAIVAMGGVLVVTVAATILQGLLISRIAVRLDNATLDHITQRMLALPMRYFNTRRTGDIERRLAGMQQVRQFVVQTGVLLLTSTVTLVVALIVMLSTSQLLTLVFLGIAPLYLLLMRFSTARLRPVFETLEEAFSKYQSHQIDAIRGIETVKALGAEDALRAAIGREFDALAQKRFRADFTIITYVGLVQLTTFFTLALFLYLGALQVLAGDLTIGGLVAFNSLVLLANGPILTLLSVWDEYQASSVLLNRLNDIFDQEPEQGHDHSELRDVPTLEGTIEVHDLSFRFGGPRSPEILRDVTFSVPAGTRCAIVGRSGSGKTTLIKCLAGLIEPTTGTITYDGVEMRELSYRQLRRQIGFVLQENYMFDGTIASNIAFGEPNPDLERVRLAARIANAQEFIERLPLNYNTRIGESGLLLSGGQRQRIAIARSVYRRPPVLIFDEATSALDTESERAVKESMDELLIDRTSFVIAHRLSTIRDADIIIVLDQGQLVETGTHDELLQREGLYAHLCGQQLEL